MTPTMINNPINPKYTEPDRGEAGLVPNAANIKEKNNEKPTITDITGKITFIKLAASPHFLADSNDILLSPRF
ncbi:MAG: hypothetical protein NWE98_03255 [Candidatus Bathyarchaeota archaeon]|nr:hypothetical protein [Candidatus Bathyarchaeota archaeon]